MPLRASFTHRSNYQLKKLIYSLILVVMELYISDVAISYLLNELLIKVNIDASMFLDLNIYSKHGCLTEDMGVFVPLKQRQCILIFAHFASLQE